MTIETQYQLIDFILGISIILCPFIVCAIVFKKETIKWKFIFYLVPTIFITSILVTVFGWWSDKSNMLLLAHYGYNNDGMNDKEFYGKVLPQNMKRVHELVMIQEGIGWPLKVIICYIFYSPYFVIVYFISYYFRKLLNFFRK